jgi:hypothetical protein
VICLFQGRGLFPWFGAKHLLILIHHLVNIPLGSIGYQYHL